MVARGDGFTDQVLEAKREARELREPVVVLRVGNHDTLVASEGSRRWSRRWCWRRVPLSVNCHRRDRWTVGGRRRTQVRDRHRGLPIGLEADVAQQSAEVGRRDRGRIVPLRVVPFGDT